ncbi:hypothetical protein FRX31_018058 [Thalictrum thalictroides]|uniref:Uncharacterized protein n=1 Tax=Thalictrum thalictroides TaxID=46969 RepID=A0A7J6W7N4_THATH|nr:hypothetical protein FRX31_018058 [Thalictrum thalictroides]
MQFSVGKLPKEIAAELQAGRGEDGKHNGEGISGNIGELGVGITAKAGAGRTGQHDEAESAHRGAAGQGSHGMNMGQFANDIAAGQTAKAVAGYNDGAVAYKSRKITNKAAAGQECVGKTSMEAAAGQECVRKTSMEAAAGQECAEKTSMEAAAGQECVGVSKVAKGVAAGDGQHGIGMGHYAKEIADRIPWRLPLEVYQVAKKKPAPLSLGKTAKDVLACRGKFSRVSAAGQRQFGELAEGRELPCVVELGRGNGSAVGCGRSSTIADESDLPSVGKISTKYPTTEGGLVVVQGDKAGSNATDSGQSNAGDGEGIATGRQGSETDQRKEGQLNANMTSSKTTI